MVLDEDSNNPVPIDTIRPYPTSEAEGLSFLASPIQVDLMRAQSEDVKPTRQEQNDARDTKSQAPLEGHSQSSSARFMSSAFSRFDASSIGS